MGFDEESLAAFRSGDNERTRELADRWLASSRSDGDRAGEVEAVCMLSRVQLRCGDYEQVAVLADQARLLAQASGERRLERIPLHMQAVAARMTGNRANARRLYLESIELNRSLDVPQMVAAELRNLGYVELHDGHVEEARDLFAKARALALELGSEFLKPYLVADAAVLACHDGDLTRAARLLGAAQAAFDTAGVVPDPDDAAEQAALRVRLERALGAEECAAGYVDGAGITLDDALDIS